MKKSIIALLIILIISMLGCNNKNVNISDNPDIYIEEAPSVSEIEDVKPETITNIDVDTFNIVINDYIKGKSRDSIVEDNSEAYYTIIEGDSVSYDYLESYFINEITRNWDINDLKKVRSKLAVEWLMSEIVKNQYEDKSKIEKLFGYTIIKGNHGVGRFAPSEDGMEVVELAEDLLIRITGKTESGWYLATQIEEDRKYSNELDSTSRIVIQSEFWIHEKFIIPSLIGQSDAATNVDQTSHYSYIVNNEEKDIYVDSIRGIEVEYVPLRVKPEDDSSICGYVYEGNLLEYKVDELRISSKDDNWWLVSQFISDWDVSPIGWIELKYLDVLGEDSIASQGFVRSGSPFYENSDGTSSKEFEEFFGDTLDFDPVMPVNITQRENNRVLINRGINTFSGWVDESLISYKLPVTSEINYKDMGQVKVENTFIAENKYERVDEFSISNQLTDERKKDLVKTLEAYQDEFMPFIHWEVSYYGNNKLILDQGQLLLVDISQDNYGLLGAIDVESLDVGSIQGSQISQIYASPSGEQVIIGSNGVDGEPNVYFADFMTGNIDVIDEKVFLENVDWYENTRENDAYIISLQVSHIEDRVEESVYWNSFTKELYDDNQLQELGELNRIYSNNVYENWLRFEEDIENLSTAESDFELSLLSEDGQKLIYTRYGERNDKSPLRFLDFDIFEVDMLNGERRKLKPLIESSFYINDFIVDILTQRSSSLDSFTRISDELETLFLKSGRIQLDTIISYDVINRVEDQIMVKIVYSEKTTEKKNPIIITEVWTIKQINGDWILNSVSN